MAPALESLRILGTHPVVPTEQQFREEVALMWGEGLTGSRLAEAEENVRDHFANLFLIEIAIEPAGAEPDWSEITQPTEGLPRGNWQVAYDEQPIGDDGRRWAFFFHYLDRQRPLSTPVGDRALPEPTPVPPHLEQIEYSSPG